ncbi:MAG: beta-galactosidase [Planctomycetota bacterium]|jgi:beta-galactosidase
MASVTFDGQSFFLDGRRVWVLGASIEYARVPPEAWADRIAAAKQAGFNTIATSCPWLVHEPRKGRFSFHGSTDVRRFVELCGAAGMWVMLRPGPYIGGHYDAGGLPSWLVEQPDAALREANEPFLERVSLYFRKLLGELADLQVTNAGPILLVQSEHAWLCSNQTQADRYLREVTRYLRENAINVPIVNANDLWQEAVGTIDTWRGWDELLVHLRQLRVVQPNAPRLVSEFNPATFNVWGDARHEEKRPETVMQWLAQVLAAGAQPVVWPFHGGTNFGFLGGRRAGRPDGFVATRPVAGAPLGEAGGRGAKYNALKRLVSFANHFGHVFAELDADYHPVALDLGEFQTSGGGRSAGRRVSAVHLRGSAGQIVFVFGDGLQQNASLLLEQGIRLPVALGDQPVAWCVLDVDLRGSGRLDYANLCPFGLIGRSMLVLQGPARAPVYLSIDGSPFQAAVPTGSKPTVLRHKRITVVLCNQEQIDETYCTDSALYVGVGGLAEDGTPLPGRASASAWTIDADGAIEKVKVDAGMSAAAGAGRPRSRPIDLAEWQAAPASAYATGESPRFATLDGPETLAACGAALGYGWYRMQLKVGSARKRRWHLPQVADRAHLYLDGKFARVVGVGRGADRRPFEQGLAKGDHTIVALVDNLGRFSEGNDLGERKGLFGHIYEVKRIGTAKPKPVEAAAVDPFTLRGYIAGRTAGQLSDSNQALWTFTHTRKAPILIDVDGAEASGTFVLNNEPIAYYAGAAGSCLARILLVPAEIKAFRRGKNNLRFAPDARQPRAVDKIMSATTLYECVDTVSSSASWAFAKWEPPVAAAYRPISRTAARAGRGVPCWWRTSFVVRDLPAAMQLDTAGLSKGHVFVNGQNLGRYFTATDDGRTTGPQQRLYVPGSWVKLDEENELLLFDEHGFAPHRARIVFSDADEA